MKHRNKSEKEALIREVLTMNEDGAPVSEIALELDISSAYVYTILGREGAESHAPARSTASQDVIERVVEAYTLGLAMKPLLEELDLTYTKMYTILHRAKVPVRQILESAEEAKRDQIQRAIDVYVGGGTLADVYAETGVNPQRLYQELAARGVPTRQKNKIRKVKSSPLLGDPDPV